MREVKWSIGGWSVRKGGGCAGVVGEGNVTALVLTFDESWDGLAKTVTFWDALGRNPVKRTLTADLLENLAEDTRAYRLMIPAEPLAVEGSCTAVIDGYADGKRARSVAAELEVKYAPVAENAGEPVDPTPSQAEQLQEQIDALLEDISAQAKLAQDSAAEAAESAEDAEVSERAALTAREGVEEYEAKAKASADGAAISAGAAQGSARVADAAKAEVAANADKAKTSADNAKTSETASKVSETAAGKAATDADTAKRAAQAAQTAAETAKRGAEGSATAAGNSATQAAQSATGAAGSASAAAGSATTAGNAQAGAEGARDTAVTAKGDAVAAKTASETAKAAAEAAKAAAKTSETNSKASETAAGKSAATASTKAAEAARSATQAGTAAGTSTTKAAEASQSAIGAAASAGTAKTEADRARSEADRAEEIAGGKFVPLSEKGAAGGVAQLDGGGKVPAGQLPAMNYVPNTRRVNDKALSADITLAAGDVGALPLSGGTMMGDLDMGINKITFRGVQGCIPYITGSCDQNWLNKIELKSDVGPAPFLRGIHDPVDLTDATNKRYVDEKVAGCLPTSGGTLTGNLWIPNELVLLQTAGRGGVRVKGNTESGQATIKFVDNEHDNKPVRLLSVANPASPDDAATKGYVDEQQLVFTGKTVAVSAWAASSTYSAQGYAFRAFVACAGVTTSHHPNVSFSCADAVGGNFAPVAESYAGGVYIYCKTKPAATVTIPSVVCVKGA